jgi:hypothetical protein
MSQREILDGDISVDISALPETWPFLQNILNEMGLHLDQVPETFTWTNTSSSFPFVTVDFGEASPSTSTVLAFASIAGLYDIERIQLTDGSYVEGLLRPNSLFSSSSTYSWSVSTNTTVQINTHSATIEQKSTHLPQTHLCSGRPIARLNETALRLIADRLRINYTDLTNLEFLIEGGFIKICWK